MRIPDTQPRQLFEVEVPTVYSYVQSRPSIAGESLLCLAGGSASDYLLQRKEPRREWRDFLHPTPPPRTPVLVALDRSTGEVRYVLTIPTRSADGNILPSLAPTVRADGTILLGVYQQNTSLTVYALAPDGEVMWDDEPYSKEKDNLYDVMLEPHDLSIKHWLSPVIAGSQDTYLVSWLYRQVRFARMEYRRPGHSEPLWSAPEWWLGTCGDVIVGATVPRVTSVITARDLISGKALWSLSGKERIVAATSHELVLFVVPPLKMLETLEMSRAQRMEEAARQPTRKRGQVAADYPPIVAYDPRSGGILWSVSVPGAVVSVVPGPEHVCAIAVPEAGRPWLLCADRNGEILWSVELRSEPLVPAAAWARKLVFDPQPWRHDPDPWPVIVGVDSEHVLWESRGSVHCFSLLDGRPVWRLDALDDCRTNLPRVDDRLVGQSTCLVWDGVLYRRGWKLRAYTNGDAADETLSGES